MKKPEMIMFDYGQTLISETRYDLHKAMSELLARSETGSDVSPEMMIEKFEQLRRIMNTDYECNHEPCIRFMFRYMAEYFGLKWSFSYEEAERIFWDTAVEFCATPGVEEFVRCLEQSGVRMAVISNIDYTEATLTRVIRRFLPNTPFEFIMATCEYLVRKPHGEIFELACRKADISPDRVWYVGNDATADVLGAYRAGMTGVWYKGAQYFTPHDAPDCPHIAVDSWDELRSILDSCEREK